MHVVTECNIAAHSYASQCQPDCGQTHDFTQKVFSNICAVAESAVTSVQCKIV